MAVTQNPFETVYFVASKQPSIPKDLLSNRDLKCSTSYVAPQTGNLPHQPNTFARCRPAIHSTSTLTRVAATSAEVADKPEPITDDSPGTFDRDEVPTSPGGCPTGTFSGSSRGYWGFGRGGAVVVREGTVEGKYIGLLLRGGVRAPMAEDLIQGNAERSNR